MRVFGKFFPKAWEFGRGELANIMYQYGSKVVFTEKIRNVVDCAYESRSDAAQKERFYGVRATSEEAMEVVDESEADSDTCHRA